MILVRFCVAIVWLLCCCFVALRWLLFASCMALRLPLLLKDVFLFLCCSCLVVVFGPCVAFVMPFFFVFVWLLHGYHLAFVLLSLA